MTNKTTNKHEKLNVNPKLGGYSDFRLWPCYMVFSFLMLSFGPSVGWLGSLIIVGTPSFLIARALSKKVYVPYEQYDSDRYIKDVEFALANETLPLPRLEDYENKPKSKVVVEQSREVASRKSDNKTGPAPDLVFDFNL